MQCADPAAAMKGPEGEGKPEQQPPAAGQSGGKSGGGGRGAKGWQYRSFVLDWSSAMLLLRILLLCEVCTLLFQMETLQSRHLPAQMDWLSVSCMWRQQNRSVVHLCALRGVEGHQMAETNERPGCAGTECLVILIGSEQLGHR